MGNTHSRSEDVCGYASVPQSRARLGPACSQQQGRETATVCAWGGGGERGAVAGHGQNGHEPPLAPWVHTHANILTANAPPRLVPHVRKYARARAHGMPRVCRLSVLWSCATMMQHTSCEISRGHTNQASWMHPRAQRKHTSKRAGREHTKHNNGGSASWRPAVI
jgi:hypothetical protein